MPYKLPSLKYSYNALEPYIDAKTMEIHYTKHHQTYLDNLNKVLTKYPEVNNAKLETLLENYSGIMMDDKDKIFFKNNCGGYLNHNLYWEIMSPKKHLDQNLIENIKKEFRTVEEFKKIFTQTAIVHFGSGWVWLVKNPKGKLKIYSLPNQDSPYLNKEIPLIGLDLWEHAYYLNYQNRRSEYIENWWKVLKLF